MKKRKRMYAGGGYDPQLVQAGGTVLGAVGESTGGVGGSTVSGIAQGAMAGAALGPPGVIAGGVIGGVMGFARGQAAKREKEKQQILQRQQRTRDIVNNSSNILSTYPTNGVLDATFAKGGKLQTSVPFPTSGGVKESLSSDGAVYEGNTHEEGGIQLGDEIEIEDQEVIKEDKVFSDRLRPVTSQYLVKGLIGFNIKDNKTFAKISEELLRKKGKYESASIDTLNKNTGKVMATRVDQALEIVFADQQEQNNNSSGMKKKAYGGFLTDPTDPVKKTRGILGPTYIKSDPRTSEDMKLKHATINLNEAVKFKNLLTGADRNLVPSADYLDYNTIGNPVQQAGGSFRGYEEVDPIAIQRADSVINATRPIVFPKKEFQTGGEIDTSPLTNIRVRKPFHFNVAPRPEDRLGKTFEYDAGSVNINYPNVIGGRPVGNFGPTRYTFNTGELVTESTEPTFSNIPNNIDNEGSNPVSNRLNLDMGDVANAAGTIANSNFINRLKTTNAPQTINSPRFSYTDMSSPILNRNARSYREAVLSTSRSGMATPGTIASMYASKLNADADVASQEASRRQSAIDQYQNRNLQVDQFNVGQRAQTNFYNTQRSNEKIGLQQANTDNFVRGILGNKARRDTIALDREKAKIIGALEGQRGILERLKSNPQLAETLKRILGE